MSTRSIDGFTAEDVAAAWDEGAQAWEAFVESGEDYYRTEVHGPGLLAACGDVRGQRVLDLGCGQGFFSRQLARRGATVVGVDVSPRQIENARRHEAEDALGIEYVVADGAKLPSSWEPGRFDLVTACMSIHDMPDPPAGLLAAASVLTSDGRLCYSAPNPTTDTPFREWERDEHGTKLSLKIDRYFETGPRMTHWNMKRLEHDWHTPFVHMTLSEMTTMIAAAGFLIRGIHEPRPTAEQVARRPDLEDCFRLPYFLVFDCVPSTSSG